MILSIDTACGRCYECMELEGFVWSVWSWRENSAVQSFYVDSRVCVRVGNGVSEWFLVNVGLRQGCVMSPWLFNVYMDGMVREVNVRVLGKGF